MKTKKPKKSKKHKKSTVQVNKNIIKLNLSVDKLLSDPYKYQILQLRLKKWLSDREYIDTLIKKLDQNKAAIDDSNSKESNESISPKTEDYDVCTYEHFMTVLLDEQVPFSMVEIQFIIRILKNNSSDNLNRMICYKNLYAILDFICTKKSTENILTNQNNELCAVCLNSKKFNLNHIKCRFCRFRVVLIPYADNNDNPKHLTLIFHSNSTIANVINTVKTKANIYTNDLYIWKDKNYKELLSKDTILDSLNFESTDNYLNASCVDMGMLYYDFEACYYGCPILYY
ncbi:hypothetical protein A3Q56_05345 [Intoshia linei]|uniref:Uncharacterized protein n=1 Tax=Intoshia linei TaxID=1819745 RepID=A0A177AY36_9BILA|nr:hypothetical protein A3Q56_05345 [Intoshia linei]